MLKMMLARNINLQKNIAKCNYRLIFSSSFLRKETDIVDMPDRSLPIPQYQQKENETIEVKRARLLYQSRKRVSNDWDIFYYATNVKPTPPELDNEIMNLLKKHVKNENKETRYRQPDLVFD
ncbi:hypothetical protein PVAND_011745 [Polypedilum vanderplanki]|uniref:Uncharacterized protein n=1 Tax=Polypedilum vanderplanki TaxID=319348 RepID=A0A9J6CKE4_POLVA|nr:hypothetical protein PVAND_011745 [Polypedilum vanderplanki]